jgi:hypothetical protein
MQREWTPRLLSFPLTRSRWLAETQGGELSGEGTVTQVFSGLGRWGWIPEGPSGRCSVPAFS